jgi:hypothetical protein
MLDVNWFQSSTPRVLAASARITNEHSSGDTIAFRAEGIADTNAVVRILCTKAPRRVTIDNNPVPPNEYEYRGRTLLLRFTNKATPQQVQVDF